MNEIVVLSEAPHSSDANVNHHRYKSSIQMCQPDSQLKPWSQYEYSVSVTNKAGTQSTDYYPIRTAQSVPSGLAPPIATVTEGELYMIQLVWFPPLYPNGEIIKYSLERRAGRLRIDFDLGIYVILFRSAANISDLFLSRVLLMWYFNSKL